MNLNLMVATLQINFRENMASDIISNMSSGLEMGNRYLTMILLMARLSMHILQDTFFFGVNNVSTMYEFKLSLMNSYSAIHQPVS